MELRNHLLRMVEYERFANSQWLDFIDSHVNHSGGAQLAAEADQWFWHIGHCYKSWFDWLSDSETIPSENLRDFLDDMYAKMAAYIQVCPLDEERQRSHPDYGTWAWITSDVIFHALTHGNYHRGHVRALTERFGFEEWPDTDWEVFTGRRVDDSPA